MIGLEKDWNYKSCILLGIGIGVCALSYYNAYGYILLSVIMYFTSNLIKKISIKTILKKGLIISAIAFLIAGWWFIRSIVLYNGDFLGLDTSRKYGELYAQEQYKPSNRSTPAKMNTPITSMLFDQKWIKTTIDSFIGYYGHMSIRMNDYIYLGYNIIFIIAIIGILFKLFKKIINRIKQKIDKEDKKEIGKNQKEKRLLNIIMFISIIIPIFLSIYYSYYSDFQPQGRYIMPIIIPFMYFIVKGIKTIADKLVKNCKIKNTILGSIICVWAIMPVIIYFVYIK